MSEHADNRADIDRLDHYKRKQGNRPGWILYGYKINGPQAKTIALTVEMAKQAHYTNVRLRINGEWREFEADWIKDLVPYEDPK